MPCEGKRHSIHIFAFVVVVQDRAFVLTERSSSMFSEEKRHSYFCLLVHIFYKPTRSTYRYFRVFALYIPMIATQPDGGSETKSVVIHTPHLYESPLRQSQPTPQTPDGTMLGRSAATAARVAARSQPKGQKRTFIDYLTNYPDRVTSIGSVPPERRPQSFSVSVALSYRILRRFNVHDQRI